MQRSCWKSKTICGKARRNSAEIAIIAVMEEKMVFNTNSAFPLVPLIVRQSHCAFSCSPSHSFCSSSNISCSYSCQYCASAERWDWTIEMAPRKCYAGKARKMSFTVKGITKKEHMDVEILSHGGADCVVPHCRILLWLWTAYECLPPVVLCQVSGILSMSPSLSPPS